MWTRVNGVDQVERLAHTHTKAFSYLYSKQKIRDLKTAALGFAIIAGVCIVFFPRFTLIPTLRAQCLMQAKCIYRNRKTYVEAIKSKRVSPVCVCTRAARA